MSNLIYDEDELLNKFLQIIDSPSNLSIDDTHHHYLSCEHNREGDSYR
ncbi:hypothetical protein GW796_11015 [archaeon]|nr:hypothetical protein [archaeon]NCQ52389.1 hypothetical protein [archaeon]